MKKEIQKLPLWAQSNFELIGSVEKFNKVGVKEKPETIHYYNQEELDF